VGQGLAILFATFQGQRAQVLFDGVRVTRTIPA
jgi:hypothetical protein